MSSLHYHFLSVISLSLVGYVIKDTLLGFRNSFFVNMQPLHILLCCGLMEKHYPLAVSWLLCAYMAVSDWCLTLLSNGHICDIFLTFRHHATIFFLKQDIQSLGMEVVNEIFIIIGSVWQATYVCIMVGPQKPALALWPLKIYCAYGKLHKFCLYISFMF
jgi:hypothetical protein